MVVSDDAGQRIRNGRPLVLDNDDEGGGGGCLEQPVPVAPAYENRCRAYALDGRFLGVLRFDPEKGQWQPEKVFL